MAAARDADGPVEGHIEFNPPEGERRVTIYHVAVSAVLLGIATALYQVFVVNTPRLSDLEAWRRGQPEAGIVAGLQSWTTLHEKLDNISHDAMKADLETLRSDFRNANQKQDERMDRMQAALDRQAARVDALIEKKSK